MILTKTQITVSSGYTLYRGLVRKRLFFYCCSFDLTLSRAKTLEKTTWSPSRFIIDSTCHVLVTRRSPDRAVLWWPVCRTCSVPPHMDLTSCPLNLRCESSRSTRRERGEIRVRRCWQEEPPPWAGAVLMTSVSVGTYCSRSSCGLLVLHRSSTTLPINEKWFVCLVGSDLICCHETVYYLCTNTLMMLHGRYLSTFTTCVFPCFTCSSHLIS